MSIEACLGPNEWNLRFDVERNVSLLKRICSAQLSEGSDSSEEQVETSLDSCLYVQACGIQLADNTDPSLLHVGSSFMFRTISLEDESGEPKLFFNSSSGISDSEDDGGSKLFSSKIFDPEVPALSVLKLQSDVGLEVLKKDYIAIESEVHPP